MTTHELSYSDVSARPALASRWLPLPVVLAGTFMVVLDFFIVNVALPSMQSDLGASDSAIEWVIAGYALTSAIFVVTAGRLGDRFGRRRMFSMGLALFTLASAGWAWPRPTPLASTILSSLEPERAGAAFGMLTTMQNVGNALGVAVTGVIFFGALHSGYVPAFELAVGELAILLVGVAALTRLLPRRA